MINCSIEEQDSSTGGHLSWFCVTYVLFGSYSQNVCDFFAVNLIYVRIDKIMANLQNHWLINTFITITGCHWMQICSNIWEENFHFYSWFIRLNKWKKYGNSLRKKNHNRFVHKHNECKNSRRNRRRKNWRPKISGEEKQKKSKNVSSLNSFIQLNCEDNENVSNEAKNVRAIRFGHTHRKWWIRIINTINIYIRCKT